MIVLALAVLLQSEIVVPPRGPQTVEEVRAISQYISAVSMKASILRSCADYVEPASIDTLRAGLMGLPEVAHVKDKFAELVDAMITAPTDDLLGGAPTADKCRIQLGFADTSLEELLPNFRATLPVFVGEVRAAPTL